MEKSTWTQRLIKWFYGLDRTLDEYEQHVLDRAGHHITVGLMAYLLLSGLGMSFLAGMVGANMSLVIWQFTNLGVCLVAWGYLSWAIYKLHLSDIEVTTNQYQGAIKAVLKKSQRQTLVTVVLFQVIDSLSNAWLDSASYWQTFFSWPQLRTLLIFAVVMGGASVLIGMARVKVVY